MRPLPFSFFPLPSRYRLHPSDFHESDDATKIAISFTVAADSKEVSGLTSPGTALGAGQKVNLPADTFDDLIRITFTLTNDQWIDVSEVRFGTPRKILGNPFVWRVLYALTPDWEGMRCPHYSSYHMFSFSLIRV